MNRSTFGFAGALLAALVFASPAAAAVGQARTAGADGHYDRNASVVQDGAETLMFFARSQNPCNRLAGCDADQEQYDLYVKRSSDGGRTYGAATFVAANPDGAGDHRGRTIAATVAADGTVFVFWANGGSQSQLYYVREAGSGFSPVDTVDGPGTTDVFNVEAVTRGGQILLYTEETEPDGYGVYARQFDTTTGDASAATVVELNRNIPKAIVDNDSSTVRMTYVDASGYPNVNVEVESSADGLTWAQPGQVAVSEPGVSNWDPNLIQKPNGQFELHFAPDDGSGRQRIGRSLSNDFAAWTAPVEVTPGFQGGVSYWDYWPEAYLRGNQVVLHYTSERRLQQGQTSRPAGIGHVWTDPGFGGLDGLGNLG